MVHYFIKFSNYAKLLRIYLYVKIQILIRENVGVEYIIFIILHYIILCYDMLLFIYFNSEDE